MIDHDGHEAALVAFRCVLATAAAVGKIELLVSGECVKAPTARSGRRGKYMPKSGRAARNARISELHASGLSDRAIAREIGVSPQRAYELRKGLGLPATHTFGGAESMMRRSAT